jgi:hypothetical protein
LEYEPPTEPLPPPAAALLPVVTAPPPPPPAPAANVAGPFSRTRYFFTTGLRAGEVANIRDDEGNVVLSYRSFATIVGVVAALVSGIIVVAGIAAVIFLASEGAPLRGATALILTIAFAFLISLLVPRINVTLYDEHHPALTLQQRAVFPSATYVIAAPNGTALSEVRKTFFSRLGRNRWTITQEGRYVGEAIEDGFFRALLRKFLGKFSRSFETDVVVRYGGMDVARIHRRDGDTLEIGNDALDRRVAVALATLVLGREP